MFPAAIGHGRAGDGQPGPNLLANTPIPAGTNWSNLPPITNPDPSAITAPIPVNSNVSFSPWAPRKQTPTYVQLWNLTLEKQLGSGTVAQIAYVGSHSTHLPVNYAYNIFRADFFNLPNHPQFAEPVGDLLNSSFGRITRNAINSKTVQLGLHLYF